MFCTQNFEQISVCHLIDLNIWRTSAPAVACKISQGCHATLEIHADCKQTKELERHVQWVHNAKLTDNIRGMTWSWVAAINREVSDSALSRQYRVSYLSFLDHMTWGNEQAITWALGPTYMFMGFQNVQVDICKYFKSGALGTGIWGSSRRVSYHGLSNL